MVRRDFLKLSGLFSAALLVPMSSVAKAVSLPVEADSQGKRYRGSADGKIHVSENAGETWQLHTNFGSEFSIHDLRTNSRGSLQAKIGFAGHSFKLELVQNGRNWKTV